MVAGRLAKLVARVSTPGLATRSAADVVGHRMSHCRSRHVRNEGVEGDARDAGRARSRMSRVTVGSSADDAVGVCALGKRVWGRRWAMGVGN